MPLAASKGASKGWDIPTLKHGYRSLTGRQQRLLAVFCRVYYVRLLILDDSEFHVHETVMSLGEQRAIATALNTIVFNNLIQREPGAFHCLNERQQNLTSNFAVCSSCIQH